MRLIKRILILILPLLLLLPLLPAAEAQSVDTSQTTQLDILYEYGGTPIANAQVHIYRVGSIGSSGSASLQLPYSAYPIDPGLLSSGEYPQAAKLLYHYILLNKKTPDKILITDENGEAQGNLDTGLFLIVPQKFSDYRGIFRSEPALVSLPYRASTGEPWSYQVTYMPKCAFTPKNRIGERSLYVTKKWQLDSEEDRPKEITVYLLRDQTILEQVKLNAANRWLYRWDELSENYDWRVVEKPVSGYTVTMRTGCFARKTNKSAIPCRKPRQGVFSGERNEKNKGKTDGPLRIIRGFGGCDHDAGRHHSGGHLLLPGAGDPFDGAGAV